MCQEHINTHLQIASHRVHIITDDPIYREYYESLYEHSIEGGQLDFGLDSLYDEAFKNPDRDHDDSFQLRQTTLKGAICDFLFMSFCDSYIGTTGSSVTTMVEWLKEQYSGKSNWHEILDVGDWQVAQQPSSKFREAIKPVVANSVRDFLAPNTLNISHKKAGVLDWLHESHCEEIYNICSSAILKGGRAGGPRVADFVKNILLEQSRVSFLNRKKFNEASVEEESKEKRDNWFTALLKMKVNRWAMMNGKRDIAISWKGFLCFEDQAELGSGNAGRLDECADDDVEIVSVKKNIIPPWKQSTSSSSSSAGPARGTKRPWMLCDQPLEEQRRIAKAFWDYLGDD